MRGGLLRYRSKPPSVFGREALGQECDEVFAVCALSPTASVIFLPMVQCVSTIEECTA